SRPARPRRRRPGGGGRLVGGRQPAEPFGHGLGAVDDGRDVGGVVGRAPQDRPRVVGGRLGERPPDGAGQRGDAGGGDAVQAAAGGDQGGGGADALDGSPVDGGGEAGRAAHLDGELVEFPRHGLLREEEGLFGEVGDGDP